MPIASYANKVFKVNSNFVYTFDGMQYSSQLQIEKQDAEGTKPSTYNKGPDLDTMSFKIKLDKAIGLNPRNEWEDWQQIMNNGKAHTFILGNKPLGKYSWLLVTVTPSNIIISNTGEIISMELELGFLEYVRAGKKKPESAKDKNNTSSPGISDEDYRKLEAQIFNTQDKSETKRKNLAMQKASGQQR